jgi:hypothetical protein
MLSKKAFAEEFMLLGRCLMDLIPSGNTFNEVDNKLVVDEIASMKLQYLGIFPYSDLVVILDLC